MSKKHRGESPNASPPRAAPIPSPSARAITQDDLDGDPIPSGDLPTDLAPAAPGDDLGDLDALADADPDAPVDLPPLATVDGPATEGATEPPVAELDGMRAPPTPDAAPAPPGPATERLEDAVAGVDPTEPSTASPDDLPTSTGTGGAAPKTKKAGGKKSPAEALFGDAEKQCERASAAAMIGPVFDLIMAALPVYFSAPSGMGWTDVLGMANKMIADHGTKYGPMPFDLNPAALADGFGALMAGGPDVFVVKTITVYQLEPAPDTMPMAAMPGTLKLPDSFAGRKVLGQQTVASTPGMAIVYNLTEKGSALVGPVLEAVFNFLAKYADLVRPALALAIGGVTGYRMWRDARSPQDITVRHQPPEPSTPSA